MSTEAPGTTPRHPHPPLPDGEPLFSRWRIRLWIACGLVIVASAMVFGADVASGRHGHRLPAILYDWSMAMAAVAMVIPAVDYGLWRYTRTAQARFLAAMEQALDDRMVVLVERHDQLVAAVGALGELMAEAVGERVDGEFLRGVQSVLDGIEPSATTRVVPLNARWPKSDPSRRTSGDRH